MAKRGMPPKEAAATEQVQQPELGTLMGKFTLMYFQFRPLANGSKLRLVFEGDWKHLDKGTLEMAGALAQATGDLRFDELPEEPKPAKGDLPGQAHLPLTDRDGKPLSGAKQRVAAAAAGDEIG